MNNKLILKYSSIFLLLSLIFFSCKEDDYSLGTLTTPTDLVINTQIAGQSTANPYGDGSGVVTITANAKDALSYRIAYTEVSQLSAATNYVDMPAGSVSHKFTTLGNITYRVSVIAYGTGGTSTVATKDITVYAVYNVDPAIVKSLTNNSSKTWKIDPSASGHIGVGPWKDSYTPEWYTATPNEKAAYPCFYNARFTFTQVSDKKFTITDETPDGIFTKTGALAGVPNIPATGKEDCYAYTGTSSAFSFIGASSGVPKTSSTQASILLDGKATFIAYGATQKEYEILSISDTNLYLRVRGTETDNAWYFKLVPAN